MVIAVAALVCLLDCFNLGSGSQEEREGRREKVTSVIYL